MNKELNEQDASLRYVRGEMDRAEAEAFEARLAREPALAELVREDRRVNARLAPLMAAAPDREQLTDRILAEIDREAAPARILTFPVFLARHRAASFAAAAAALLLAAVLPGYLVPPVAFDQPEILSGPALRQPGEPATAAPRYTPADFQEPLRLFQETLNRAYREQRARRHGWILLPRREWSLQTTIQEMRAGRLAVAVTARPFLGKRARREWTEYYRDLAAWQAESPTLAARIAEELSRVHETP